MNLLDTIYRHENVKIEGKTFFREAVRGIVFRDMPFQTAAEGSLKELLMIYSPINGDYKFPGGGIETGESHVVTLRRELREEGGATLRHILGEFGKMIEYANAFDDEFETYKQISYYYFCKIEKELGKLYLEDYEEEFGFQPVWVSIEEALNTNEKVLQKSNPAPRWTRREVAVLKLLKNRANLIEPPK